MYFLILSRTLMGPTTERERTKRHPSFAADDWLTLQLQQHHQTQRPVSLLCYFQIGFLALGWLIWSSHYSFVHQMMWRTSDSHQFPWPKSRKENGGLSWSERDNRDSLGFFIPSWWWLITAGETTKEVLCLRFCGGGLILRVTSFSSTTSMSPKAGVRERERQKEMHSRTAKRELLHYSRDFLFILTTFLSTALFSLSGSLSLYSMCVCLWSHVKTRSKYAPSIDHCYFHRRVGLGTWLALWFKLPTGGELLSFSLRLSWSLSLSLSPSLSVSLSLSVVYYLV